MGKLANGNIFKKTETYGEPNFSGESGYTSISSTQPSHYLNSSRLSNASIIRSIVNRIAVDASMVDFQHIKLIDEEGNQETIKDEFYERMTVRANIDQTGRSFLFDLFWSLLEEGTIAVVPIDTYGSDILTMRVGKIEQWYPKHVRLLCYDEISGSQKSLVMSKEEVAIIESPFMTVFDNSNYTLNLLNSKVRLMNSEESKAASGKINGFLQLPYQTGNTIRDKQATKRLDAISRQMSDSKYGIPILEANEKFIPTSGVTNNLFEEIMTLKQDFFNEIGITDKILSGEATSQEIMLYNSRAVDPVIQAVSDSLNATFLTKTARTQGHKYVFYRDPFRMLPIEQLATVADLFSRNAIYTPNEIRKFTGKPPHPSPLANQLFNRNIADGNQNGGINTPGQDGGLVEDGPVDQVYQDEDGNLVDMNGNPVDEYGNRI